MSIKNEWYCIYICEKPKTNSTKIDLSSLTFSFQNLLSFKRSFILRCIIKYLTKIIKFYVVKPTQHATESKTHESTETRKRKINWKGKRKHRFVKERPSKGCKNSPWRYFPMDINWLRPRFAGSTGFEKERRTNCERFALVSLVSYKFGQ